VLLGCLTTLPLSSIETDAMSLILKKTERGEWVFLGLDEQKNRRGENDLLGGGTRMLRVRDSTPSPNCDAVCQAGERPTLPENMVKKKDSGGGDKIQTNLRLLRAVRYKTE